MAKNPDGNFSISYKSNGRDVLNGLFLPKTLDAHPKWGTNELAYVSDISNCITINTTTDEVDLDTVPPTKGGLATLTIGNKDHITSVNKPPFADISGGYGVLSIGHSAYKNQLFFPYGTPRESLYFRSTFYDKAPK